MSKFPIQDYSHMGVNNLNQLVQHQLGAGGFEVVRTIYDNIQWLNQLFNELPSLNQLSNNLFVVKGLETYLGDIVNVAENLRIITNLNSNLPLVNELAPRIDKFANELEEVNCRIKQQDVDVKELTSLVQSSIKNFEDLYANHVTSLNDIMSKVKKDLCQDFETYKLEINTEKEKVLSMYREVSELLPVFKRTIENQQATELLLLHLKASDTVTIAQFTQNEKDCNAALKAIKLSESYGNDECLNRLRLNYKLQENSVGEVLEVIIKEGNDND